MYDVVIIGRGPAGLSAALYTVRANLKTLVIGRSDSVLKKAEKIENYFGFSDPISGKHLLDEGEKQVLRIGTEIVDDDVVALDKNSYFKVTTTKDIYTAKAVLLATGRQQKKARIENLAKFEGKGVSYCTTCDGFFYRNRKVGVLGYRDYAVHEAMELKAYTNDITIFTDGREIDLTNKFREAVKQFGVNAKPILKLDGQEVLETIFFKDGTSERIDGLFVAYESASSVDFARKLGIMTEKDGSIIVDKNQQTNLEGLFAAGDCTSGFRQIATAVGQGAVAGRKITDYVRSLENNHQ